MSLLPPVGILDPPTQFTILAGKQAVEADRDDLRWYTTYKRLHHIEKTEDFMDALLAMAKIWIEYLARSVEIAAALIIGAAALQATVRSLILFFQPGAPPEAKNGVRLTLGRWLAVALELELAADILNTAVTPTWMDIEKLAAIATLRTALNYFLEKEIAQEAKPTQIAAEAAMSDTNHKPPPAQEAAFSSETD